MTEAKQAAQPERNRINLTKKDYEGAPSTLCRGCGHDAITASVPFSAPATPPLTGASTATIFFAFSPSATRLA